MLLPAEGGLGRGLSVHPSIRPSICLSFCDQVQKGESLCAVWWWHCISTNRMSVIITADESLILIGYSAKLWRQCACSMRVKGLYAVLYAVQYAVLCMQYCMQYYMQYYMQYCMQYCMQYYMQNCMQFCMQYCMKHCASQYSTVLHITAQCFKVSEWILKDSQKVHIRRQIAKYKYQMTFWETVSGI